MDEKILHGGKQILIEQSVGELLIKSLRDGGNRDALVDGLTDEKLTCIDLLEKSISLAQHLTKMGLKKNDVIAICSENSINYPIPCLAGMYLGITVSFLNYFYTEREIIHALDIAKPKIIFCSSTVLNNIISASISVPSVEKIILLNKDATAPQFVFKLEDLLNLPVPYNFNAIPMESDDVATILYSSGTTGLPKGVMLTHRNYLSAIDHMANPRIGNFNPSKIILLILPFYHSYGLGILLSSLAKNMKSIVLPRFEEYSFLKTIEQYKITFITLVPPLLIFLTKSPLVDNYNLSSLNEFFCGAAPLSKDIKELAARRLNVKVRQGYGLSETTLATNLQPIEKHDNCSIGVVLPGVDGKVIDINTRKSLGPFQEGELCFRGNVIMKGYVRNPKATAETIKNGWLHTGDIGYYDNDQHIYVIDRFKELIKYKGFQVPPAEIEGLLLKHPEIIDCAVIGKPDDNAGELPMAFVVKRPNAKITDKDIIYFVAENVSYQKRLHGGVTFVESIPKNPTGKILRRVLRDRMKPLTHKM